MALVQGEYGQYYHEEIREQKTVYAPFSEQDHRTTEFLDAFTQEEQKTISAYERDGAPDCVTGWLVCTKGELKGKSFSLHNGWNYAGRALDMDVVMSGDLTVAREKHMGIVYDSKTITFHVVPINGMVCVDGKVLTEAYRLEEGTLLLIGRSSYMFVPFCKKGREWNER